MAGIAASVERSYSPVFRPRGLQHDDPLEVHAERVAEIALEMDMALEFMGDVGKFLEAKEDIEILGNCEEMAEQMIHNHIDIMDKLNQDFLSENIEADRQLEELMEMQKALGYEVQQAPQLSIEGQKIVEKEKKKREKIASIYDIVEEREDDDGDDAGEERKDKLSADEEEATAVVPYVPILQRGFDEINHAETEMEMGESLMLMFDHVRQQTDHL